MTTPARRRNTPPHAMLGASPTATAFAQSLLNGKDSREAHPTAPQP